MGDVDRDIGALTEGMASLKEQVAEMRRDFAEMRTDTAAIKQSFSEIKGGWKVVISLAAFAGAGLSWVTTHFFGATH